MLYPGNKKRVTSPIVFTYTKVDLFFSFFLLFSNFLLIGYFELKTIIDERIHSNGRMRKP